MKTWHKSKGELIAYLTLKNALCAAAGRPCPVAVKVLERLTSEEK